jgi:SAM-dependent methyltransferase
MLHATDIYGEGDFVGSAAPAGMLSNPERYASQPFRRDHLTVQRMDGRKLEFPDDSFDFVVCFSSIEHFGGRAAQAQSIREMARVTRPGGAVVVTTEVILNGTTHNEYFTPAELGTYLIDASGLRLLEDVDYRLSAETLKHPIDRDHPQALTVRPHVALSQGGVVWTSVCLVLVKP